MKGLWTLAALGLAAPLWSISPQDTEAREQDTESSRPLRRIDSAQELDLDVWKDRLREPDLDLREQHFANLVSTAQRSRSAEDAIRAWAAGDDQELAWTARLALRELQRDAGSLRPRSSGLLGDPFNGPDLFHWDEDPFHVMPDRLRRMLEEFKSGNPFGGSTIPGLRGRSDSFRMQTTPDGVEVEVEEVDEDGKRTKKIFSAESLEALLEAHPELRARIDTGTSGRTRLPFETHSGDLDKLLEDLRWDVRGGIEQAHKPPPKTLRKVTEGVQRTDVLGVYLPKDAAESEGLRVDSVQPGSLAAAMRVQPGDVLLAINGTSLKTVEDIRRVLANRRPNQALRLRVRTAEGEEEVLSWSPTRD